MRQTDYKDELITSLNALSITSPNRPKKISGLPAVPGMLVEEKRQPVRTEAHNREFGEEVVHLYFDIEGIERRILQHETAVGRIG